MSHISTSCFLRVNNTDHSDLWSSFRSIIFLIPLFSNVEWSLIARLYLKICFVIISLIIVNLDVPNLSRVYLATAHWDKNELRTFILNSFLSQCRFVGCNGIPKSRWWEGNILLMKDGIIQDNDCTVIFSICHLYNRHLSIIYVLSRWLVSPDNIMMI